MTSGHVGTRVCRPGIVGLNSVDLQQGAENVRGMCRMRCGIIRHGWTRTALVRDINCTGSQLEQQVASRHHRLRHETPSVVVTACVEGVLGSTCRRRRTDAVVLCRSSRARDEQHVDDDCQDRHDRDSHHQQLPTRSIPRRTIALLQRQDPATRTSQCSASSGSGVPLPWLTRSVVSSTFQTLLAAFQKRNHPSSPNDPHTLRGYIRCRGSIFCFDG
jgi:hypothetical protein